MVAPLSMMYWLGCIACQCHWLDQTWDSSAKIKKMLSLVGGVRNHDHLRERGRLRSIDKYDGCHGVNGNSMTVSRIATGKGKVFDNSA